MTRSQFHMASEELIRRALATARAIGNNVHIRQLEEELRHRENCAKRGDELIAFIERR